MIGGKGLINGGRSEFFFNSINGGGLINGGRKLTLKMEKFTLIYSKTIIDKVNR